MGLPHQNIHIGKLKTHSTKFGAYPVPLRGSEATELATSVKNYSSKEILKLLNDDGWYIVDTVGSHVHISTPQDRGKLQFLIHVKIYYTKQRNRYLTIEVARLRFKKEVQINGR